MEDKMKYVESKSINQKKKSFLEKVKAHKVEIIIGGITIVSVFGVVLMVNNWDVIRNQEAISLPKNRTKVNSDTIFCVTEIIENTVNIIQSNEKIVDVSKHIRNLPVGYKASSEKLLNAIENGIELNENQTWVDAYLKICA